MALSMQVCVVLVASFFTHLMHCSMVYVIGVYYISLDEKYPEYADVTPWIGSLYVGMLALGAPLASVVANVFSCRTCVMLSGLLGLVGFTCSSLVTDVRLLFVTLSLLAGLGSSFGYVGSIAVLGYYFPYKPAIASGFVLTGAGLGIFVHPSLARYLIDYYGVSGTFLIAGGMAAQCMVFGLLMPPSKLEIEHSKRLGDTRTVVKNIMCGSCLNAKDIIKDPVFSLFLASVLFFGLGFTTTLTYMPDYFKLRGASFEEAAFSVSMQGLANIISRLMIGFAASDSRIGGGILYPCVLSIMTIISCFISMFADSIGGMYAYGFLLGMYTGCVSVMHSIRTFEIVGVDKFAHSFGLVMFVYGPGLLFGPPIADWIFRMTNVYTDIFIFASCMFAATAALGFASTMCSRSSSPDDKESVNGSIQIVSDGNLDVVKHSTETISTYCSEDIRM